MTEHNIKKSEQKFHKDTFDKTTEGRRNKVLTVAIDEFAANGYNATSINEIAKKAHISIGAMYSYFASKEDLFLTIVNNSYFLMEETLKEVADESEDIFDCIRKMLATSKRFALEYPELNQIYLDLSTQALSKLSYRLSNQLEIITPKILTDVILKAKKEGTISPDVDEKVVSFCIDNVLMMYQFSFSSDYYKERMKIYIGDDLDNIIQIEESIFQFITAILRKK